MFLMEVIIAFAGIYLGAYVLYNLMLFLAHFFVREPGAPEVTRQNRFAILVPAHDEELLIGRLTSSINEIDYPAGGLSAVVIADNCSDNTAAVARENGATVYERTNTERGGKGYAIKWGLEKIGLDEFDAVFVIDADSMIDRDLLNELNKDLLAGKNVIQCYNGVANPDESWFTRLLDVSRTIGNEIVYPAKEKLGLSINLMGNGMCFSTDILKRYGWEAFTVGEDWEYYARLVKEGEHISFNKNARVFHQESTNLKQATSQRMRWSSGRFAVIWKYGLGILYRGLIELDLKKLDASEPLILPNPSLGINMTVFFLVVSYLLPMESGTFWTVVFLIFVLLQLGFFITGVAYTKNRFKNFLSIFIAPVFLVWKMCIDILSALGGGSRKWVRTERKL